MSYVIGPGVQAAIDADGGEPRSDEVYVILQEGHKVSQTYATTGVYNWFEEDNVVRRSSF